MTISLGAIHLSCTSHGISITLTSNQEAQGKTLSPPSASLLSSSAFDTYLLFLLFSPFAVGHNLIDYKVTLLASLTSSNNENTLQGMVTVVRMQEVSR